MEESLFLAMNSEVIHEIEVFVLGGGLLYFIKVSREDDILANSDKNKIDNLSRGDGLRHKAY